MREIQIKERNILNTCVRTFCSAGTKIPRHLLQKKMNTTTTMNTTMTRTSMTRTTMTRTVMTMTTMTRTTMTRTAMMRMTKDHLWFSSLLQSYPASPPGPGAGDPEDISGGEEPATEGFKPHLPFPLSPATVRVRTS